jgi:cytochrome c biogenesis protein CcmG, thiol:disulfide interchange protein DsbE
MKKTVTPSVYVIAICALSLYCTATAVAQGNASASILLDDLDGSSARLSEYLRGGAVYMTFWALWCEPCKQELRALKSFAKEHADEPFTILAVNQDSPKSIAKVKAYVRSQNYPFAVVLDPNAQVLQAFNGQNLPFAVLLDKDGNVVSTRTGYLPGDEKEIEKDILKLISK